MGVKVEPPAWKLAKLRVNTEPLTQQQPEPSVNTKPDRHKPGYMAQYMRDYRKSKKAKIDQA